MYFCLLLAMYRALFFTPSSEQLLVIDGGNEIGKIPLSHLASPSPPPLFMCVQSAGLNYAVSLIISLKNVCCFNSWK